MLHTYFLAFPLVAPERRFNTFQRDCFSGFKMYKQNVHQDITLDAHCFQIWHVICTETVYPLGVASGRLSYFPPSYSLHPVPFLLWLNLLSGWQMIDWLTSKMTDALHIYSSPSLCFGYWCWPRTHKYLMEEGVGLNKHWLPVFIKLWDMHICI